MRLTKATDYALRVLIYLASHQEDMTMPQLAEKLDIPYNNISKIIQALARAGFVQTRQGKNGGVRLAKAPGEISLKSVVDLIDGPTRLSDCFHNNGACSFEHFCKLQGVLLNIQGNIDKMLGESYISQMY